MSWSWAHPRGKGHTGELGRQRHGGDKGAQGVPRKVVMDCR